MIRPGVRYRRSAKQANSQSSSGSTLLRLCLSAYPIRNPDHRAAPGADRWAGSLGYREEGCSVDEHMQGGFHRELVSRCCRGGTSNTHLPSSETVSCWSVVDAPTDVRSLSRAPVLLHRGKRGVCRTSIGRCTRAGQSRALGQPASQADIMDAALPKATRGSGARR